MQKVFKSILSFGLAVAMFFGITVVATNSSVELAIADTITDYYAEITATGGNALLGQVHDLITKTHTRYTTYNDCKDPSIVKQTDPGTGGQLMEFYAQANLSSTWQSGNNGTWNREHVWCQSLSNGLWGETGGGSDLFHIRPTESRVNSTRGNNKYGVVSTKTEVWYRDASNTSIALAGYNYGGVFEPKDSVKGDVARIVMYVYTHYNTAVNVYGSTNGSGSSDYFGTLKFTNIISASSESEAIKMLLEWNESDPVDQVEITRNEVVYGIQGNRNPFVDHPEYANYIWGDSTSVELESISLNSSTLTLSEGKSAQLTVTPYPSTASANVSWTSSNEAVATVSANGLVTAKAAGTATITATSTENPSITATAQVTVEKSNFKSVTITLDSFDLTYGYGFKSWSEGGISGTAWIYGGSSGYPVSSRMQFNKNQSSYYIASSTPTSGSIRSVTVKSPEGTTDRDWKLLTSDSPYGEVAGKPTNGNDQGTKTVTQEGVTWTLSGEDTYFALTYELTASSGAAYIYSIIIEYESADSGNENQSDVDNANLQQFHIAVEDIVTDGTLEVRLASINKAIAVYQSLTDAEKASAEGDIQALKAAIEAYNQTVNDYNEDAKNANKAAGAVRG